MRLCYALLTIVFVADAFNVEGMKNLQKCFKNTIRKTFDDDETLLYVHAGDADVFSGSGTNPQVVLNATMSCVRVSGYKHYHPNYVIHVKHWESVSSVMFRMKLSALWHRTRSFLGTYLIVTPMKKIHSIFEVFWSLGIVNLIVLVYDSLGNGQVFTSNPQSLNNQCGLQLKALLTSSDCLSTEPLVLPKTLRKFSNCKLTYISSTARLRTGIKHIEAAWLVLNTMVSHLNVTNVTVIDPTYTRPTFDLFTLRPLLKVHVEDDTTTGPYFSEDFVWIVPSPKKVATIKTIGLVMKKSVWCLVLVAYVSVAAAWWLVARYLNCSLEFGDVLLRVFSLTLFGSAHNCEMFWSIRYIFMAYVIYSIHIQIAFTSKLTEILMVPQFEPGIKTVQELADSNISILMRRDFYVAYFSHEDPGNTLYNSIKRLLKSVEPNALGDVVYDVNTYENNALMVQKSYIDMMSTMLMTKITTIEDNRFLIKFSIVFVGMDNAYVFKTIDKVILILTESGIYDFFIKNVKFKYKPSKLHEINEDFLTLKHLYFVYIFWFIGLMFGFLMFVGEIFWYHKCSTSAV